MIVLFGDETLKILLVIEHVIGICIVLFACYSVFGRWKQ